MMMVMMMVLTMLLTMTATKCLKECAGAALVLPTTVPPPWNEDEEVWSAPPLARA